MVVHQIYKLGLKIFKELNKRRPGQSKFVTQRKEKDLVHIMSGVFEGKTTGTKYH